MKKNIKKDFYSLEETRDRKTGVLLREAYRNAAGNLDHGGLPSIIDYDAESGNVEEVMYHRNGVLHREDGPAHFKVNPANGIVTLEFWRINGKLHRGGALPASILRTDDGRLWSRRYSINGVQVAPAIEGLTANKLVKGAEFESDWLKYLPTR